MYYQHFLYYPQLVEAKEDLLKTMAGCIESNAFIWLSDLYVT